MTVGEAASKALKRFSVALTDGDEVGFAQLCLYLSRLHMQKDVSHVQEAMQRLKPGLHVDPDGAMRMLPTAPEAQLTARVQLMVPLCFDINLKRSSQPVHQQDWIKLVEAYLSGMADDGALPVPVLGQHAIVWAADDLSALQILDLRETKPDIVTVSHIQHYKVKASVQDLAQRPDMPVWEHPDVEFLDSEPVQTEEEITEEPCARS